MATKLNKRTVVIIGGGLTAMLMARQLTAKGHRGGAAGARPRPPQRRRIHAAQPARRAALDTRGGLGQDLVGRDLHGAA